MILIAAVAVGTALVRRFLADTHALPGVDRVSGWQQLEGIFAAELMLMVLTLALALAWGRRLRRAPELGSLSTGAVSCLLASAVLAAVVYHLAVNYATERVARDWQNVFWRIGYWSSVVENPPLAIGLLTLCIWNFLILSGNWTAEPTWLDRGSRAVSICWISCAVVNGVIIPAFYLIMLSRM
jgi:hypothetical protein